MALKDTPLCDFGWQAPAFTLKDAKGQSFDFTDFMGDRGLLIAFVCNHCPYVIAVADRLANDAAALKVLGINTVAIMSNDYQSYPTDAPDKMIEFADKYGWTFPYLIDEDQSIARAYGAICTPDFLGLNAQGELQYRGRLDDAKMGDPTGRNRELVDAMRMIAETGQGPREQTASMGCSIKWR